jgi:ribosomal protein S18 acetylase RimI-like enzyme
MNSKAKVDFIVDLHKKNSQRLGFIPKSRVEQYVNDNQVFFAKEGGLESGFCIVGNGNNTNLKIYQHCIQEDLRRLNIGKKLFNDVEFIARNKGYETISLRCRANLEANKFWKALDFINYGFENKITQRTKKGIYKWIYKIKNPKQFSLFEVKYGS